MFNQRALRKQFLTLSKYLVAVVALAWVVYTIDMRTTIETIRDLSMFTLLLLVAASIASVLARVAMWYVLVTYFTAVDLKRLLAADLIIKFVNTLFPSRLSGRSIAPIVLRHFTELGWSRAVAVTVAQTGLYAVLYGLVGLFGVILSIETYGSGLSFIILLSVSVYLAVGAAVVLAGWRLDIFDQLVRRLARLVAPFPAGNSIATALNSFRSELLDGSDEQFQLLLCNRKTVCLFVVTWVVAVMIVPAIRIGILFSATGISGIEILLLPLYIVVAYSVTILPITPGGIGVAEATGVAVFLALGAPEGAIVTVVFLDRFFGLYLPSLFGWFPLAQTDLRTIVD